MLLLAARFASSTVSRLASADLGSVTIWDIDMKERSDNKLTEQLVVKFASKDADGECAQYQSADMQLSDQCVQYVSLIHFARSSSQSINSALETMHVKDVEAGTDMAGRPPFMWHPNQSAAQILAIGDNGQILFAEVPAVADAAADTGHVGCGVSTSELPTGMACVQCPGPITALAFSADGGKLAAVVGQNEVRPDLHHSVYLEHWLLYYHWHELLAAQCCFPFSSLGVLSDPSH